MAIKVGINGFGRIGRLALRAAWGWPELEFVQLNDPAGDAATHAHLLNFDSVHGRWQHEASSEGDCVVIDGKRIKVTATNNLTLAGNYNTIAWEGVNGATRYNVYKLRGGIYGYIGQVQPAPSGPIAITAALRGDGTNKTRRVVVDTAAAHGRTTGDRVLIENTGVATFDGYWQITVIDADTFEYQSNVATAFTAAYTGTVSAAALSLVDDNVLADTF